MNIDKLKKDCGDMLRIHGVTAESKAGIRLIYAFWLGASSAKGEDMPIEVTTMLLDNRAEECVK